MIRLVFYAAYPEMIPIINQVFRERPDREEFHYEVIQDVFNNPLTDIDADVVIARGFTAHSLQSRGIICAELKVSGYDVIAAIDKCLRLTDCRCIGLVGAFNMVYGAENAGLVYPDLQIKTYPLTDETLLEDGIHQAIADGCDALVGGYTTNLFARRLGIPAVMIESGRESVNNAIAEAKMAAEISFREKARSNEIANTMNYAFQGILSADSSGIITYANNYCHTLLKDIKHAFVGHPLQELFPGIPVDQVIHEGQKILSDVQTHQGSSFLVNCVPIEGSHENSGCVMTFQLASQIQGDERKIRRKMHASGFTARYQFPMIVHKSPIMDARIQDAMNYSYADSSILIYGETGTGKELFAQSIHNSSRRKNNPFVAINCAALPENLLESELFGYVEGAFTGAAKGGKMGFFEIAHTGTIFLDEIGDISLNVQSRLLRVLQEKEIIRLGNDAVIPVDVRVIAATNKDLKEAVRKGEFRQDLLYRLDILELTLPALRERPDDIPLLLQHFIDYDRERTGSHLQGFTREALAALSYYSWPGNIRELRNFCERICILCQKSKAGLEDIRRALPDLQQEEPSSLPSPEALLTAATGSPSAPPKASSGQEAYDERREIISALQKFRGHRGQAAQYLGMHPSTLWRKMKKYQIS